VSDVHGVAYIEPRDTARDPVPRATNHKDLPSVFLQFAVTDTGKGLSDKEMEVLFRRFSQASPKT
jgi:signal transduction histidine kinase